MSDTIHLSGHAASAGLAAGPAVVVAGVEPEVPADLEDPSGRLTEAAADVAETLKNLAGRAEDAGQPDAGEILRAQAMMATDPMLADEVRSRITSGSQLGESLDGAAESVKEALLASGVDYLADRAADIDEIVLRIKHELAGIEFPSLDQLTEPTVIVATALTAGETALLDRELTLGFITETGGPTGHVAVIARSLGVPAVVGATGVVAAASNGDEVLLDGSSGAVVINPDDAARDEHEQRATVYAADAAAAEQWQGRRVKVGEHIVDIAANVGGLEDLEPAVAVAADGVGLFRTEFLFLDTDEPPTEDAQYETYRAVVEAFEDPVVIRTLDIGGDKPARYVDVEEEENPFLGVRGMRLYSDYERIAIDQARAILRAAAHGEVWAMVPMVATVDDALTARRFFDTARTELSAEGVEYGDAKFGIMIEVPAAALGVAALAEHVDFFSIGTNDLTQYTMAADRGSSALAGYNDAAHPSVLALCEMTARVGRAHGVPTSVCGESAGDPALAVLYAAMGIQKLSMSASRVNPVKRRLGELNPTALPDALGRALSAASAGEVRAIVDEVVPG